MDRLKLFDSDGSSSDEDLSKIEINHEFAKRYEHNKTREELQRYEGLKKQGLVDSSSSDSEESSSEGEEPSKKIDANFFDALIKVKNQDPILREKDAKLFNSDEDEDGDEEDSASKKKAKKEKPMYLKDVISKQLIEEGPEFSDEEIESGDDDDDGVKNRVKTYSEEQNEMRQRFVEALKEGESDDGNEDLFKVKSSGKDDEEEDDGIRDKLDEYFGEDEKLDGDMMFLKDYFRNRMWADDGKSKPGDDDTDFSEDVDEVEKQEDYEREINFRFEENAGDRVMGHSRKVEGSVRKKDNARKSQRERKEERMAQAEFERKEELKRMKNLKKKEIREKLEKIREVAGIGKDKAIFLDKDDLEEEFDPEAHDRKMKEAFGEDYYGAEDMDPGFGSGEDEDVDDFEKPDFDKEDELLGLEKGWDEVDKSGEGFKSARERILKGRRVANGDENVGDEDEDDGNQPEEGKRKRKRKPSEVEKAVMEQFLEEYYKLDYEDTIGDLKTRFKYKPVKAKRYGLATEEVLTLDDKELNQYVSLKKLAPYREKEWKVPRIKTIQLKKQYHKGDTSRPVNEDRKRRRHEGKAEEEEVNVVESEKSQPIESNGDNNIISRKQKRKQKQAELKLSQSRLMAYGKIPSKSKIKNQ